MAGIEAGRTTILETAQEAFSAESNDKTRRADLRKRKKEWGEFLRIASTLLDKNGQDTVVDNQPARVTEPSIDVPFENTILNVQILQRNSQYADQYTDSYTAIVVKRPGDDALYDLFSVDQSMPAPEQRGRIGYISRSIVRNHFGRVASSQEITKGLQMAQFVNAQLAQHSR